MSKHRSPFVARILSSALLAAAAISLPGITVAQTVAAPPATATAAAPVTTPATAPRVFALVAAVGDQFQYVRQKESVGSNFIDNHTRQTLKVPDHSLNYAVLRGLDRAVETDYPNSERVLLAVKGVPEIQAALPQDREALTMKHVLGVLEANPARKDWDQIIVVVPKWLMSGRQGIGGKLTGIGVYVQPLGEEMDKSGDFVDDVVEDTSREQVRSRRFVAPFFYVQVSTLDAKTLKVIKSEARYDFRKIVDKESTALDVAAQFTPEQLASHMQRFVETSALKAVNEKADTGTVQVGPVKTVSTDPARQ